MSLLRKLSMAAALGATLVTLGCQGGGDNGALAAPRFGQWGVNLEGMDRAVRPGDDFFRFAAGKAWDALEIPGDRSGWGAFHRLDQLSEDRARLIIEEAAENGGAGEAAQVGGLYASFMNTEALARADAAPLMEDIAQVKAADTPAEMAALMGRFGSTFHATLFAPFVYDDQRAPDTHTVYLNLADLSLPDRDYYLEAAFADEKQAFEAYVARALEMAGWDNPARAAADVVAFETAIARVQWTRADRRDDEKMYNPRTVAEIKAMAPGFDWDAFFAAAGLGEVDRFVLGEHDAFDDVARIFARTSPATLQAWQAFRTTDAASQYLSDRFYDSYFDFRLKTLTGIEEPRERWKRGVEVVEGALGEAVGRLYVDEYFPASSKAQMEALVGNLKTAMGERIRANDWMSEATKAEAQRKLAAIRVKIGYPDKWRDYSGLQVDPADLYGNIKRARDFEWQYRVNKLGQPVDDEEWAMFPQTVNAYYNSTKNEIVFPAAILQPPFFDPEADPAVNYGAIGAVIGHEITHGFDDQGRKSDADGILRDWWTPEDGERFVARARILGQQYARYEPVPGLFINPDLTMGENIADVGGLIIAHGAYRASLGGREAPVIDGLSGDQRFFLAFAQVWTSKYREDVMRQRMVSAYHSPDMFRVNGVVPNIDAFYAAFDVQPTDRMYIAPEARARIW